MGNKVPTIAISIDKSRFEIPASYTKKKNVFRLITELGSEYLYQANSKELFENWVDAISGRQKFKLTPTADIKGMEARADIKGLEAKARQNMPSEDTIDVYGDSLSSHGNQKSSDAKDSDTSVTVNQRKSSVLEKWLNRRLKQ